MDEFRHHGRLIARAAAFITLFASVAAGATAGPAQPGWNTGDALVYELESRDRTLGTWETQSVIRSVVMLHVDAVVPGGETRVRLKQDNCELVEADAGTQPDMLAAQHAATQASCWPWLDVHVADDTDAVRVVGADAALAHVQAVVETAFGQLSARPSSEQKVSEAIDDLATEEAIAADVREQMRLFRIPPGLPQPVFQDERPNPHDGAPASWTHTITWQAPDATGQRRATWRMVPEPAAIRAALLAQWNRGLGGTVQPDSNLGRALAGDFDLSLTTEYVVDASGTVTHAIAVQEMRFGDDHRRAEYEARLRAPR